MTSAAEAAVRAAAELLVQARVQRAPLTQLASNLEPADLDTAYAIQEATIAGILESLGGGAVVGYKIGCTSDIAKEMLGLEEPFYGRLLSPTVHQSPARLAADDFTIRVIEPEVAYQLGHDLPASEGPYDGRAVLQAVTAVMGSIEIVDTRWADWSGAGGLRLVADNGSAGAWVAGTQNPNPGVIDPERQDVTLTLYRGNGIEAEQHGSTGATLGSSLNALAWLANELNRRGQLLRAGDLVTTGTTTPVVRAESNDRVTADFGPLGQVTVTFD